MTKVKIRRLRIGDVPRLLDIIGRAFSDNPLDVLTFVRGMHERFRNRRPNPLPLNLIRKAIKKNPEEIYVAQVEGKIVGLSGLNQDPYHTPGRPWLYWTAIDPLFQRQGLGTQLLEFVEKRARQRGVDRLYVDTASHLESALNLWQKNGFVEKGRLPDYFGPGEDWTFLEKIL